MTTQDDVYWCRVTLEVSTTDIDWLSSEFHDLLATKTTGVALAAVRYRNQWDCWVAAIRRPKRASSSGRGLRSSQNG